MSNSSPNPYLPPSEQASSEPSTAAVGTEAYAEPHGYVQPGQAVYGPPAGYQATYQQPYQMQAVKPIGGSKTLAVWSFIVSILPVTLGLLCLLFFIPGFDEGFIFLGLIGLFLVGFGLGPFAFATSIILSSIAITQRRDGKGYAVAGLVFSIVGLVCIVLGIISPFLFSFIGFL